MNGSELKGGRQAAVVQNGGVEGLEPVLERLAKDPGRLTASGLWKALRADERVLAARYYLEIERTDRKALVAIVARTKRARPETVRKWPDDELAGGMKAALSLEAQLASSLLEQLHRTGRRAMLSRFRGLLGASSRARPPDSIDKIVAKEKEVHAAADRLVAEYGMRNVVVYFLVLALRRASVADHLWSWMGRLANGTAAADVPAPVVVEPSEADPAPVPEPASHDRSDEGARPAPSSTLTVLDRVLMQSIVASAQGVAGSLSSEEVDAAVNEFVSLNGRRPISYYHAGFRDTLFGRVPRTGWPALGRDGTRCYWAGAIQGWARSEAWPMIVREYDGGGIVKDLGDGTDFASAEALEPTVRALADEGRTAELARFVQKSALEDRLGLYELLLDAAVRRLRAEDAAQARPVLDLLVATAEGVDNAGASAGTDVFIEARRRQAQCLMRLKEHHGATVALEDLLVMELDGKTRSLVQADLGLLAGGFSALWEVQLPLAKEELEVVVEKLSLGERRFEESIQEDADDACNGRYCLGVLALGRAVLEGSGYEEAAKHLTQARSVFMSRRERYARMVPRTNVYFGVASICSLSPARLAQGSTIMVEGMKAGAVLPPYLVASLVDAMELVDQDSQRFVYKAVVEAGDDATLEIAANSQSMLTQCRSAVRGLRARGRKKDRPGHLAAADLRAALFGYVANGDREEAADVLSDLEAMAQRGVGAKEFAEILADPSRYEPAWSQEDAAIALAHCYEAQGRLEEATEVLREYFHQYASRGTEGWLDEAEGLLRKVEEFGIDPSLYKDMRDRYDALLAASRDAAEGESDDAEKAEVKVLVVGGNEVQARAEDQVRAKLHRTHPHVRVEFIHTGWGSNWQKPLEEFTRKLSVFDAVVIMRFMRTELGKRIRKECSNHPWRSCWGPGQMAQVTAVIKAAEAASPMRRPGR